ncbi:hypothetical protein D9M70_264160 [compost metagenome]
MTKKWSKRSVRTGRSEAWPACCSHDSQLPGRVSVYSSTLSARSSTSRTGACASNAGLAITVWYSAKIGTDSNCSPRSSVRRMATSKVPLKPASLLKAVDTRTSTSGCCLRKSSSRGISQRMAKVAGAFTRTTLRVAMRP